MSDWTWEYSPDAAHVTGGLSPAQVADVEALARRLADAVAVRRVSAPDDDQEAASGLKVHGEGPVLLWYQEYYLLGVLIVVRVQHLGPGAGAGG